MRHWRIVDHAFVETMYRKSEQGDLAKAQVQVLGRLVREEFG